MLESGEGAMAEEEAPGADVVAMVTPLLEPADGLVAIYLKAEVVLWMLHCIPLSLCI